MNGEYSEFYDQVETGFDLESIYEELDREPWQDSYSDPDYQEEKLVYLGSVFVLCPSGKYYMPWACSNVDPCEACHGHGCDYCGDMGSREAFLDAIWYDKAESELETIGAFLQNGEGDPTDIFAVRVRDKS